MAKPEHSFILTVVCPDTVGVVADVAGYLRDRNLFIEESSHYGDPETGRFFMRTRFNALGMSFSRTDFAEGFSAIAEKFTMQWQVYDTKVLPRVLIMVSRLDHCLNDLLYRYRTGALPMHVPAIVSNHMDMASLAKAHNIPYFHVPISAKTKPAAEQRLREIIEDTRADTVVLARYMQVLSDDLCRELAGKAINIHHSFLPSFKGARPYHRAHDRGVKLIGATAHFVTADLDEGPIIEQSVERVDHTQSAEDLVAVGRDVEAITLARALKYHLEHRVFLNGIRTVVF
ncbi:MAG: formyltetrahydrofolate deformylase [Gammaproteobacteria bacterium]|nr:formyltetrahydrofolate deformylase [Gammaproteobacteria bacterium]